MFVHQEGERVAISREQKCKELIHPEEYKGTDPQQDLRAVGGAVRKPASSVTCTGPILLKHELQS